MKTIFVLFLMIISQQVNAATIYRQVLIKYKDARMTWQILNEDPEHELGFKDKGNGIFALVIASKYYSALESLDKGPEPYVDSGTGLIVDERFKYLCSMAIHPVSADSNGVNVVIDKASVKNCVLQ
jgi:hypothetical protein